MKNKKRVNSTISACLVIRNEERIIKRCLNSIAPCVDEIIVVHDGKCLDKSLKICREYKARVFERHFIGMMEEHFVFCLNQARGDWILRIDADEFLTKKIQKIMPKLVKSKTISAYKFLSAIWDGEKYTTKARAGKIVLFKKSDISFLGIPHQGVEVHGTIETIPFLLEHRRLYNNYSLKVFRSKWLRWAKIHADYLDKPFKEIKKFQNSLRDWPKSYIWKRKYSLILFPFLGIYYAFKSIISGGWKDGWNGIKPCLLYGLYNALLYLNLGLLRLKKSS